MSVWQWDIEEWQKWVSKRISYKRVLNPKFLYRGRLVTKKVGDNDIYMDNSPRRFNERSSQNDPSSRRLDSSLKTPKDGTSRS